MSKAIAPGMGLLQLKIDSVWYTLFCAKAFTFDLNQDEIETTSINSTSAREYIPGMSNSTASANGITYIENASSKIAATYCLQLSVRRQLLEFRVFLTAQDTDSLAIEFNGFFTNINLAGGIDQFTQGAVSIRVSGDPVITEIVAPPVPGELAEIYLTLNSGSTSVSNIVLDDVEIFLVEREGVQFDEVAGTPSGRQFRYNDAADEIVFDSNIPGNPGGESVHILYKPN